MGSRAEQKCATTKISKQWKSHFRSYSQVVCVPEFSEKSLSYELSLDRPQDVSFVEVLKGILIFFEFHLELFDDHPSGTLFAAAFVCINENPMQFGEKGLRWMGFNGLSEWQKATWKGFIFHGFDGSWNTIKGSWNWKLTRWGRFISFGRLVSCEWKMKIRLIEKIIKIFSWIWLSLCLKQGGYQRSMWVESLSLLATRLV